MNITTLRIVTSFTAFVVAVAAGTCLAQEEPQLSLSGTWVLNKKASNDLGTVRREGMGDQRPSGGRGSRGGGSGGGRPGAMGSGEPGGMGGGRRGGMGDGEPVGRDQADAQRHREEMERELSRLEIFYDAGELNITDGLDISHLMFTDGRETKIWTPRGEAKATAGREGVDMVVRWKTNQGTLQRVRRYRLSTDGQQMTVVEERCLPDQDKMVKLRFVYDRQE